MRVDAPRESRRVVRPAMAGGVACRVVVRENDVVVVALELVGGVDRISLMCIYCLLHVSLHFKCPRAHSVHPGLTYFGLSALFGIQFFVHILPNFSGAKLQQGKSFVKSVLNFFRICFNTKGLKRVKSSVTKDFLTINS